MVLRVFRLPCVFRGFCGWVLEASCSPAQMRMQDGLAFRGSPDKLEYLLYEILVQGRCYGLEDLQASSQHMKKTRPIERPPSTSGHQVSESEVSMSNVVHLLTPAIAFEVNRRIVLARVRVTLPVVLLIRKPAVISAPGMMCPASCPDEIVCRDAYVYEYRRVLSPGTMSPV